MKKHILTAGAAALAIGFGPSLASAATVCPVAYEHPSKAAKLTANLVQAFVSCGNPGGNVPNATTETGTVPTCFPAQTYNEAAGSPNDGWHWGPKSQASISFKAGKNKVEGNPPGAVDLFISLKMSDIHDVGGPITSSGNVSTVARATLIDRAANDLMTVIDFPTGFPITATTPGKIQQKSSATEILNALSQPALPACTTIEVVSVLVKDTAGNVFPNLGTFLQ